MSFTIFIDKHMRDLMGKNNPTMLKTNPKALNCL